MAAQGQNVPAHRPTRSGPPGIGEMARPAPGRDQHHVEAHVEAAERGPGRDEKPGRADEAFALAGQQRLGGAVEAGARLDLDKGDRPATAGNEIYFAGSGPDAPGEDAITLETENERGQRLRAQARLMRGPTPSGPIPRRTTPHQPPPRDRSSARA